MIDWERNRQLLLNASELALRGFFSEHPLQTLCAVGFVFELGNASEQFDLCANTHTYFASSLETSRTRWPDQFDEDAIRWNSGDFEFPAGLPCQSYRDTWAPWTVESRRLHQIAAEDLDSPKVYDGLIEISCETLAVLARNGVFGDWSQIDFNVAEVGDTIEVIKEWDQVIRRLLARGA